MSFEQPPEEQFNKEGAEQESYDPKKEIITKLDKGFLDSAEDVAKEKNIDKGTLELLVKENVLDNFAKRNHKDTLNALEHFNLVKDFLNNKEFVKLGKERVELKLSQGNIEGANEVLDDLHIDKEFLKGEEAKKAAESGIKNILAGDKTDKAIEVQKMFNIDDSVMEGAVKNEIKVRLKDNLVVGAVSLQEKFGIPSEFINDAVKEEVLTRLSSGNSLNSIASLVEKLNMDVTFLNDPKIKEAVKARIDEMMEMESSGREKIPEIFNKN
jgi:hypothetical protein